MTRTGIEHMLYRLKCLINQGFLNLVSIFISKIEKAEGYFTLGKLFLFTFLSLSAKVESDNHQYDIVYVISIYFSYYGKIAPNSDNGKCDDSFNFDKVCKVFKHDYLPLSRSSSR